MNGTKINYKLLIFRIFALLLSIFGVAYRLIETSISKSIWDSLDMLGYFTIQSGLLVCILFALLIIGQLKARSDSSVNSGFRGAVLLYIVLTSLIFLLFLNKNIHMSGLNNIVLYVNHLFTAVLLIIDDYLTVPAKSYNWKYLFYWLIYPLSYFVLSLLEGYFFCRFRYFFFDYHEMGTLFYILLIFMLTLSFVFFSAIIIFFNRYTKKD